MYIHKYTVIQIYEKKLTIPKTFLLKFSKYYLDIKKFIRILVSKYVQVKFLFLKLRYTYSKKPLYGV